ncbi:threonine/serine exporter family protein [Nakamurella sp. GG22]
MSTQSSAPGSDGSTGNGSTGNRSDGGPGNSGGDEDGWPELASAIGDLGTALLDAGYAVTDVQRSLCAVADAYGGRDITIGVLPGAILIDDGTAARTRLVNATGELMSFRQVADVACIARDAETAVVPTPTVRERLREIRALPALFPRPVAVLGSGLMSAGIAVVFRTTWWAVALDFLLALLVGAALIYGGRIPGLLTVLPFVAAFGVSAAVYGLAPQLQTGAVTLFVVCAPLVILIPGATITTGVVELAAGDVVSGGGRFASGLIMWATLAVGIAAGAAVFGSSVGDASGTPAYVVPGWAVLPAVVVLAVGVGLFFDAAWSLTAVLIVVLTATYGLVAAAQTVTLAPVASGIAAAVMLPLLRLLELRFPRWPAAVTFRPAFWLLVPGSLGLVAITQVSADGTAPSGQALLGSVVATVVAIAVGVQIGAVLSSAAASGSRA